MSEFNPPRATTSLQAASSTRGGTPPPPACGASRLTAGGASPGVCFHWAACAVLFRSSRGREARLRRRSLIAARQSSVHRVLAPAPTALPPPSRPWRRTWSSSVFSSRTNFSKDPGGWIFARASGCHSSSSTPFVTSILRSSSLILNLLPSYLCPPYSRPSPSPLPQLLPSTQDLPEMCRFWLPGNTRILLKLQMESWQSGQLLADVGVGRGCCKVVWPHEVTCTPM